MSKDKSPEVRVDEVPDQEPMAEVQDGPESVLKVAEDPETDEAPEVEQENWDKADLVQVCGVCGHEEHVTKAIGGVTLFMPTNSTAVHKLVCDKCKTEISLVFKNGITLTEDEKIALKAEYEAQQKAQMEVVHKTDGDGTPLDEDTDQPKTEGTDEQPQEESK